MGTFDIHLSTLELNLANRGIHMSNPNLPADVTDQDIDDLMGEDGSILGLISRMKVLSDDILRDESDEQYIEMRKLDDE